MTSELRKTYSYRISQANRSQLVVIMYDMAIDYLKDALESKVESEFTDNIKYAKRVINRLNADLDMQYEISAELMKLYLCMDRYLIKAMANGPTDEEATLIKTVISMLSKLRKSFYEVSKSDDSMPLMQNTEQVYAGLTYSNVGSSNEISQDPVSNRGFIV